MESMLFIVTIAVWITVLRGENGKLTEEEQQDYFKWISTILPQHWLDQPITRKITTETILENFRNNREKAYKSVQDYKDNKKSFWLRLSAYSMFSEQQFYNKKRENDHRILNEVEPITDFKSVEQEEFIKQVKLNYNYDSVLPTPWNTSELVIIPMKVDWRLRNAIRVPADVHAYCTASYPFAVAATIDAHINYWTEYDYAPTPQTFMSCPYGNDVKFQHYDPCDDQNGFNGTPDSVIRAYKFAILNGLQDRERHPFQDRYERCDDSNAHDEGYWTKHLSGYVLIPKDHNAEVNLMVAVALHGPVTVSFESTHANLDLMNYGGGIYDGPCGKGKLLTMMVIGYGEEKGKPYWLLQYSLGQNWGQYGYIKIARFGQCDITQQMVFPIVEADERIYGFHTAEDDWWTNLETKLVMNAVHRKYNYTSEMDLPPELKLSNDEPSVWN
ncbi:hypothetical protein GE061_006388 [Apolygus lucorum]|uniref:Peptidase C1A papain C-terminal domain-containing protein n=1 Tax=Apolygus lucorum TaxID=248454 RepID=A0A8S9WTU0_APOLU|nr:hypothetical protein GE061_006388 [Apolygus lucorum]